MSCIDKVRMGYYCYASARKKLLKQWQKYMKEFEDPTNLEEKYVGYFNGTAISSRAIDVIGKITPFSGAAKHAWILVTTDYFTKWIEAKSYAELTSKEVCSFIKENIVTRIGLPETIITDNDIIFTFDRFNDYTANLKDRLKQSTPYYP
ncbi:hypothetical protein ACFX1S_008566 [Malus domestica]